MQQNCNCRYISKLQQNGLLKGDEITDIFFRVLTVPATLGAVQNHTNEQIFFSLIDSYAKLTVVILKCASVEQVPSKALLLMKSILTSIVLKSNMTMLDIVSTRMRGQFGFLAKVFSIFEDLGISVDCVATSEVSVSLTLDPSKLWSRELIQ